MGTMRFDGVDYPDARESDPEAQGWMRGSPPPPERRIRYADDTFLQFPQNRWALSHFRELVPTVAVWRGAEPPSALPPAAAPGASAIDALVFRDLDGKTRNWADSLTDTYTDGMVILHRGRLVYERYLAALTARRPHACFSITKSYAATLAATLIADGVLDEDQTVPHYLPEMARTAYGDASLRTVLDMLIGVDYSELYTDPAAHVWAYSRAGGLRPRPAGYRGPDGFYEYLLTLRKEGEHDQAFAYKTVNTEVLCWVM